jgi:hypothetical protein
MGAFIRQYTGLSRLRNFSIESGADALDREGLISRQEFVQKISEERRRIESN